MRRTVKPARPIGSTAPPRQGSLRRVRLESPARAPLVPGQLTVGVEEEFLLVDEAGYPQPRGPRVLADAGLSHPTPPQLTQLQVEAASDSCQDLGSLYRQLVAGRAALADAAAAHGCRLLASGSAVLGDAAPPPITDRPRYRRMATHFGALVDGQSVCGCHVQVGGLDQQTALRVSNRLRPWLPVLLALSANSPFWGERASGYASWRTMIWSRWPSAGPPPHFDSVAGYETALAEMSDAGVALDPSMVYWDIRPAAQLPALEVRVADTALTVDEAILLAALVRALVATALADIELGRPVQRLRDETLRYARWGAAREGLAGSWLDPWTGRRRPAWDQVRELVAAVRPALEASDDLELVRDLLARLAAVGGGAQRQLAALRRRGELADVVRLLERQTVGGLG